MDQLSYWINVDKYSTIALVFNGVGCLFWLVCYASLLYSIVKKKFVEMPWFIAAGNLAWEFLWSFYMHPDTGMLYEISYIMAFFIDVFIFIHVIKYGAEQVLNPWIKQNFKKVAVTALLAWTGVIFLFMYQGNDDSIGAYSGYILNIFISVLYPILFFAVSDASKFSATVGWSKWLGTGFITVSMFFIFPENYVVQYLGVLCFIIDAWYFAKLYTTKKRLTT